MNVLGERQLSPPLTSSVYLAVEDVSNEIVAKDAAGRDFSTLEIIDAALEYVDSLNQNQGRGSR